jgi:UDP-N-acetyl-D-glucosamine dehydrogenase
MEALLHKIVEKEVTIGVIGLGHTGLSLAHDFCIEGFKIIGFDIDSSKIEMLHRRESYLPFLPLGHLFYLLDEKRFLPTSDPQELAEADVIIICVPTPLNEQRLPDITYIQKACVTAASAMKRKRQLVAAHRDEGFKRRSSDHKSHQLIVIQSTSYPGTTEEEALPLLEKETGQRVGVDFFLAHVPEREDAGNPMAVLNQIPRICGGVTTKCALLAKTLYEHITVKVYLCPSVKVAEATKTYENTFRFINIAFVDEMKIAFDKMGINIWEVIDAASTKPFGFTPFYPGPGIGGECIPVDPIYLAWKAKQFSAPTTMIENASAINLQTSEYVIQKISEALALNKKTLRGGNILILGVAFKKDLSDTRESPALRILRSLKERGANVSYHDYFVPKLEEDHLTSIQLCEKTLSSSDCVAILTDHSRYDWVWISQHSPVIVDTRNATKHVDQRLKKKIIL